MCGITGWAGEVSLDDATLQRMCDAVRHRGPDDRAAFIDPGAVGLGFRRLSIIDLETGAQPLFNEDGTVAVTCNGEIYNFPELRSRLEAAGHTFRSRSDAETLVHLFEECGPDFLQELQGMFAIALWDARRSRLLLARDRLGVKPLYWAPVNGGLVYGSEPGAILASGLVDARPDPEAIVAYLTLQYVPAPRTGFLGINKLEPGELLIFEDGRIVVERYWSLQYHEQNGAVREDAALDHLDALLREATHSRLISDVPLGALLSGGIDSSLVVGYMAEALPRVSTFSIDFEHQQFSEGRHARRVAELYGTEHEEFTVEPDMVPLVEKMVLSFGEPFADSSCIPTYLLCEMTRRRVTVALSGDGGDEAFAGYIRHRIATSADRLDPIPKLAARLAQATVPAAISSQYPRIERTMKVLAHSSHERYATMMAHFVPESLEQICEPDFLVEGGGARSAWDRILAPGDEHGVNRYLALDTATYLPGDILMKVDRMSMAHALEVRSPLLDYRLYEFAARLPGRLKVRGLRTKYLLRALARRRGIPEDLVARRKQGFGVPIGHWFRGPLRGWIEDILLDAKTFRRPFFRHGEVRRLLADHISGSADHTVRLWNLAMLELWQRAWIDNES
jgi:asparagine synthase (glutamine-hydrolysing)